MDVGNEILERIRETLRIDERDLVRRPGGFTWWPGRLAHHLDVGPPIAAHDEQYYPVTSRVPVLRVEGDPSGIEAAIGRANVYSNNFSYVYDREQGEVFVLQRAVVPLAGVDWRPRWLAMHFALQAHHAVTQADWFRRTVGGKVAYDRPPGRRARKELPEILTTVHGQVFLAGEQAGRCAGDFEFEAIREVAERAGASAAVSERGLVIAWPFGGGTAPIRLLDTKPHPAIGAGLAVWAALQETDSLAGAARLANWLNLRVARVRLREVHHGSWGVGRVSGDSGDSDDAGWAVGYCRFVPMALYSRGLALDAAIDVMQKLRRLDALLNPPGSPAGADHRDARSWRSPEVPAGLHA
jgi:hypothetical protein